MGIWHLKLFGRTLLSYGWHSLYSGQGYNQGIGFSLQYKALTIGRLQVITDIMVDTDVEWLRKLKKRWEDDELQQKRELSREALSE